tara:strand:- start:942 stop:1322 length:381 start_codon:yes stop_codon:yes gene_type:complete
MGCECYGRLHEGEKIAPDSCEECGKGYNRAETDSDYCGDACHAKATAPRFEVLTNTFCTGWVNLWTEGDEPHLFSTEAEAQAEIDDLIKDTEQATAVGDMSEAYDCEDYRINELEPGESPTIQSEV